MKKQEVFQKTYASQYDLMYSRKDYIREARFVDGLIRKYSSRKPGTLLSLGAGTLAHEVVLSKKGYRIHGIDFSPDMVSLARKKLGKSGIKNVSIEVGDMRSLGALRSSYDAVVSLFNVVSYLQSLAEFDQVIKGVAEALKPGGVFVFDCWNAQAMKEHPPEKRWAKFTHGSTDIIRLTNPDSVDASGGMNLSIELLEVKGKRVVRRNTERHMVRSWFPQDIKRLLQRHGLRTVFSSEFLHPERKISKSAWAVVYVAKKV